MSTVSAMLLSWLLFSRPCVGEEGLVQPYRVSDYNVNYEGRFFSVSDSSPLLRAVRANATADKALDRVLRLIERMDGVVRNRVQNNHSEACNVVYNSRWMEDFRQLTPILQIGSVEDTCNSRVDAEIAVRSGELDASVPRGARSDIVNARNAIFNVVKDAVPFPDDGNWTVPYKLVPAELANDGQKCLLDSTSAYYTEGRWYLRVAVTNHHAQRYVPDWQRHTIMEFLPRNHSSSLKMIHVKLSDGRLERSTSVLSMWFGRAITGATQSDDDFSDPIAPVSQAFRENMVAIDLASDSVTISNIAILALPMVMNIIPVAFIADMTGFGNLVYILFTDVLSTVPFLIKGIELILSSAPKREIVVSFHAGDNTLRLVEVWAVRCRGEDLFRNTGIAFVAVSLFALIVGIVLEVSAKIYMSRKERAAKTGHIVQGPFGTALRDRTTIGFFGRSRKALKMQRRRSTAQWTEPCFSYSNNSHDVQQGTHE